MTAPQPTPIAGWGRVITRIGRQREGESPARLTDGVTLTRGLGRSYGDASLPAREGGLVACTRLADRILAFDEGTGLLRAEAGLSLLALNEALLPRGWFVPVTPGTQFVTLGGMVASDVHGKNHHRDGAFGQHVTRLRIRLGEGSITECSPGDNAELFWATVGGMGLTGHILEVEVRLARVPTPWIYQRCERIERLDDMLLRLRASGQEWPMTVAWIDCLAGGDAFGRGVLLMGRWAESFEAPLEFEPVTRRRTLPIDMPGCALNRQTVRWGLNARHWQGHRDGYSVEHPEQFFYPLDTLKDWNRMYGKRGFIQWQCVLPGEPDSGVTQGFFRLIRQGRLPVYLCVLKDFGAEGQGMISFPRPGFTLALDLPHEPGKTQGHVDRMNEYVIAHGGRIYLTKDSHTRPEHFRAMEPRLDAFNALRRQWDPEGTIKSALSVRLLGDEP